MSKKCTPLWREAHFEVKLYKAHHSRTTFGSCDVEKVHAVVARSTFQSQNLQSTPVSDHFWKLRCRKSARRCGAKHISKSKCTKHTIVAPLLEVAMSKKCTPLWREAHFEVKLYKNTSASDHFWKLRCRKSARRCGAKHISKSKCTKHTMYGPFLEVQMSKKCTPLWREAHFEVKLYKNTSASDHFWKLRCRKSARRCGAKHISKSKCTKHTMYGPFLEVQMSKKCTPLWREAHFEVEMLKNTRGSDHFWRLRCRFASLRFTTLHYTTLQYTPLHYTTLHYITLHNATTTTTQLHNYTTTQLHNYTTTQLHSTTTTTTQLHSTTLHYTKLHYTTLHYTTLHYTTLHYTKLHYTTLHYTPLHSTTLQLQLHNYTTTQLHNYTPLHPITLHYTTLHYTTLHYTTLHYTTVHYLPLHFTTLHDTALHYTTATTTQLHSYTATQLHNYAPLHYNYRSTTLQLQLHNYTPLHTTTLHYITLHYTTLPSTTLLYITLHYTPLQLQLQPQLHNYAPLHQITLHYTTLRYTTLHYTSLHYTTLHSTTLQLQLHNYTPLH